MKGWGCLFLFKILRKNGLDCVPPPADHPHKPGSHLTNHCHFWDLEMHVICFLWNHSSWDKVFLKCSFWSLSNSCDQKPKSWCTGSVSCQKAILEIFKKNHRIWSTELPQTGVGWRENLKKLPLNIYWRKVWFGLHSSVKMYLDLTLGPCDC